MALMARKLRHERDRLDAAVRERHHRREAHVLRTDDHRSAAESPLALEVHELLQRARREHTERPRAGNQPRRARPLAASGREEDGAAADLAAAGRSGDRERAVAGPTGHARAQSTPASRAVRA